MTFHFKKLVRDPFVVLIAAVILIPALLVLYGAAQQNRNQAAAVNSASREATVTEADQTSSAGSSSEQPKPITDAEEPTLTTPSPAPVQATSDTPASPVCDQAKKQAAEAARQSRLDQENNHHESQKNKLRLISVVYRQYWDEEMVRHQNAVNQIETDFRASLAAANC